MVQAGGPTSAKVINPIIARRYVLGGRTNYDTLRFNSRSVGSGMAGRPKTHHLRILRIRKAFLYKEELKYEDLPWGVGVGTMEALVQEGILEPVDRSFSPDSKNYAWKLAKVLN